jgi:hypothetical protein
MARGARRSGGGLLTPKVGGKDELGQFGEQRGERVVLAALDRRDDQRGQSADQSVPRRRRWSAGTLWPALGQQLPQPLEEVAVGGGDLAARGGRDEQAEARQVAAGVEACEERRELGAHPRRPTSALGLARLGHCPTQEGGDLGVDLEERLGLVGVVV